MKEFLTVAVLHFFEVASPGPDFILVSRQCLRYGRSVALWTSLGIALGILLHVALSIAGLSILIKQQPVILDWLKIIASLYIAYLGLHSILSRHSRNTGKESIESRTKEMKSITTGFLTNVLNPKAFIFFATVFALVIETSTTNLTKIALGVYMSLATFAWFAFISVLLTNKTANTRFRILIPWIEKLTGLLLLLIALQILLQEV